MLPTIVRNYTYQLSIAAYEVRNKSLSGPKFFGLLITNLVVTLAQKRGKVGNNL